MGAVFLDLDGTLTDSAPPISAAIAHALAEMGRPVPDQQTILSYIGPPLADTFASLGATDTDAALAHYRAHYHQVMYEAPVYDGVFGALEALRTQGRRMYLMTAKPHAYARKITARLGLADYMTAEYGPELDGTHNNKADLLAHALRETGERPEHSVMVGDRTHDLHAGQKNGMAVIAALWGYGQAGEMDSATVGLHAPSDLPQTVARLIGDAR